MRVKILNKNGFNAGFTHKTYLLNYGKAIQFRRTICQSEAIYI